MPADAQALFITHPTPVYLTASCIFAFFALRSTTSLIPLVFLLTTLRLYAITVINRQHLKLRFAGTSIALGITFALANINEAQSGTSSSTSATVALVVLTTLTSALAFAVVLADAYARTRMRTQWTRLDLFPTAWATANVAISQFNSLGYLIAWSPVKGTDAYNWLLPFLGPCFIDWIVGAWVVVTSEITSKWIMGPVDGAADDNNTGQITQVGNNDPQHASNGSAAEPNRQKRRPLLYLCAILVAMAIPSYFIPLFPLPISSPSTVPITVGCALPRVDKHGHVPTVDDYIHETRTLGGQADVILWPEGAVTFEHAQAKQAVIDTIADVNFSTLAVVAVAFEEYIPANETTRPGLRRNGLMLLTKEGIKMEYYKRHLVPFVESYGTVQSDNKPFVFNYQLATKKNAKRKPIEFHVTGLTASICMDFAHPNMFSDLSQRPALILGPARTWDAGISSAMWEQAKTRAAEIGSSLLWCDGGATSISGVATRGLDSAMQVGAGSWVRTIGIEKDFDESRTLYGKYGWQLPLFMIWGVFGVEFLLERAVWRLRLRRDEHGAFVGIEDGHIARLERIPAEFSAYIRQWRRSRTQQGDTSEVGERTNLLG